MDETEIRTLLKDLVGTGRISFRNDEMDVNPAIKRLPDAATAKQIEFAEKINLDGCLVLYPTIHEMSSQPCHIDAMRFPFTALLAKGHAQLEFRYFDLHILEHYRNDPRYNCRPSDIEGRIEVAESDGGLRDHDQVFLQSFGFAYDKQFTRAVAVFLRYLSDLSEEHQRIWQARLLDEGSFQPHPDYYNSNVVGKWGKHISILKAFGFELHHINGICSLIGKPPLFRKTFEGDERPREFTFLIRPTLKEFNNFILLLDKMMSDNINKDFFDGDIPLKEEVPLGGNKVEVRPISTIRLLETWLSERFAPDDPQLLPETLKAFREVRKLRQNPAHSVEEDRFDQKYFHQQREIIIRAYTAVRMLRLMLMNHPSAGNYAIPEGALVAGRIRDY